MASSKRLTVKLNLDTSSVEKKLSDLQKKFQALDKAVNGKMNTESKVTKQLEKQVTKAKELDNANKKAANSANKLASNYKKSNGILDQLHTKLVRLAGTYLGVMGAKAAVTTSDNITKTENRLNAMNGGDEAATQEAMDKMYAAAMRSGAGYMDMAANVSKSMTLAPDAFQGNIDNAIKFQEIMAKSYTLGGASAAEQASSMYQLVQSLGAGILQGDELRSLTEGAPLAAKAIEEFAQEIYGTDMALKDMGSQGMITSEMVVAAVMNMGDEIDSQFEKMSATFEQTWTRIKNMATKAFEPTLQRLNELLNELTASGALDALGTALSIVADAFMIVLNVAVATVTWISDNWDWLQYLILAGIIVLAGYFAFLAGQAIVAAISSIIAWLAVNWSLFLTIAVIVLVIAAILWLANTTMSGAEFMMAAILLVALALMIVGLITGNTALLIIGAILIVVAIFIAMADVILGVIFWLGATIVNIVIGVINSMLQFIWTAFVEPFIGIIEWILNVCQGGFDSFGGAVANLIGQIISWFLSLGKVVTKIIDAIFGTNWTAGLSSLQDSVLAWGKSENSITLSREAPTINYRIDATDAYGTGAGIGAGIQSWVGGVGDNIKGALSMDGLTEGLAGMNNLQDPNSSEFNLDGGYNPEEMLGGIGDNTGDTAKNTGRMADSMELTEDDLKHLRNIAEMEWKKEFTTANIVVDMTNNNNINGYDDLYGIATKLSDVIWEEMDAVANGVYE